MDKSGPGLPEPVVISRLASATVAMTALQAACVATGVGGGVICLHDFLADPSVLSALFLGLGAPVLLGGNLYVAVYWARVAARAKFGDGVTLRTLRGCRRYAWADLGLMVVREQGLPVPSRCVAKLVFADGRRFVLFADREQGRGMIRLARHHGTAREWPGAPLPRATAFTLIGLGVVALCLAILIICDPVADVVRSGLGQNRSGTGAHNLQHLAIAALVVPLAGLAGVAVGVYHLVRRPVVIRPGVEYLLEGEAAESGEPL